MPLLHQLQAGDLAPYTFGNVELTHCYSKVGTATKAKKARTAHAEAVAAGASKRKTKKLDKDATDLENKVATMRSTSERTTADIQRRLDLPKGTRGRIEGTSKRAAAKRRIKRGVTRQESLGGTPTKKKRATKKTAKKTAKKTTKKTTKKKATKKRAAKKTKARKKSR